MLRDVLTPILSSTRAPLCCKDGQGLSYYDAPLIATQCCCHSHLTAQSGQYSPRTQVPRSSPGPLPSSTMMARQPSGESPTHLTLYRVARGRVSDLLLKKQTVTGSAVVYAMSLGPAVYPRHTIPSTANTLPSLQISEGRAWSPLSTGGKGGRQCPWGRFGKIQ